MEISIKLTEVYIARKTIVLANVYAHVIHVLYRIMNEKVHKKIGKAIWNIVLNIPDEILNAPVDSAVVDEYNKIDLKSLTIAQPTVILQKIINKEPIITITGEYESFDDEFVGIIADMFAIDYNYNDSVLGNLFYNVKDYHNDNIITDFIKEYTEDCDGTYETIIDAKETFLPCRKTK